MGATAEGQQTTKKRPSRRVDAKDVAELENTEHTIIVKTGPRRFDREIRIRSHKVAGWVAGVLGGAIAVVTVLWVRRSSDWLDPCGDFDPDRFVCDQPAALFRYTQMGLAAVGLVTGLAIAAYLLRFAATRHIWRNVRPLAALHGTIVFLWLVVWTLRSWID